MVRSIVSRGLVTAGLACLAVAVQASSPPTVGGVAPPRQALERIAAALVPFVANQGQLSSPEVSFYAKTLAGTLFVTEDGHLVYRLPGGNDGGPASTWSFREVLTGGVSSRPEGGDRSAVLVSYFKGSDPSSWKSRLAAFDSVDLGEPYPGVRVTLKATGNNVEKLFRLAPGSDPGAINIAVDGVDRVAVDSAGQLVLTTTLGEILFTAPVAYQVVDNRRLTVDVAYRIEEGRRYGFAVGAYDRERELVIDPLLASTYIGGSNPQPLGNYDDDIVYGMAVSGDDVIIAGATQSPDFPVRMGYDSSLESAWPDGFVTRMSADLSTVIASTYLGTGYSDRVTDLAIDDAGSVVVVGQAGYGFPVTPGAYTWSGSTPTGGGFVARLSADLANLEASSVPTPGGYPWRVAVGNGSVYFGGTTNNPDFPITPGAFQSTCCPAGAFGIRESDGFAGKLSMDLTTLESMTYLGGDTVSGIAVAPDGRVFLTDGWDYAITGTISRFDDALTDRLAQLSYYPGSASGSSRTYFNDVAVGRGVVVGVGQTYMNDLPATPGAFDTTCGTDGLCDGVGPLLVPRSDGFVAVYSEDLETTIALTYLGGSNHEAVRSVAIAADGDIVVGGETASVDFPTAGAGADAGCGIDGVCDPNSGTPTADGFIARLSADLSHLGYGSYLGGAGDDRPLVITLDQAGRVYVAGYTDSADFPTTAGSFDTSYNGGTSDAFVSWIDTGGESGLIFADDFESGEMDRWVAY